MAPVPQRRGLQQRRGGARQQFSRLKDDVDEEAAIRTFPPRAATGTEPLNDHILKEESSSDDDDDQANGRRGAASYSALLQSLDVKVGKEPARKKRKTSQSESALNDDTKRITTSKKPQSAAPEEDASGVDDSKIGHLDVKNGKLDDEPLDSDTEDASDAFEIHFESPDANLLAKNIKGIMEEAWETTQVPSNAIGKMSYSRPGATPHNLPSSHAIKGLKDIKLKRRLAAPAARVCSEFDPVQSALAPGMFSYTDLLFGGRTVDNAESLRTLACLHALNHLFKTRDRILKNSTRLSRDQSKSNLDLRDQGFTRPKVLLLLETRESCVRYMDTITSLCDPDQVENKKRFQDAFVQEKGNFSEDKPADFVELFDGNDDNDFRLGVKFTRKTMKYYSQFYNSDIILASPLGLRRAMKSHDPKAADRDFLSSIELVILDQADAMLMQNWDHVDFAFSQLNLQPRESHGCDFSRVRQWYLDQNARYLRQTIVFSAYLTPELNALFSTHMLNVAGKIKAAPVYRGAMLELPPTLRVRQLFARVHSPDPAGDPDARFKHFTTAILPSLTRHHSSTANPSTTPSLGILVFIPSYFDFLRLRNYFTTSTETSHLSFGTISEYTAVTDVRRARSHFLSGRHDVLLYTGRAHHFRRNRIRGVRHVVMYSVPENPEFYGEVVGFLGDGGRRDEGEVGVRCLFSKWEGLALERVVGSERVGKMLRERVGDTFEFR